MHHANQIEVYRTRTDASYTLIYFYRLEGEK